MFFLLSMICQLGKPARNRCNAVLKQQQLLHEQKLRHKILEYSQGSKNFKLNDLVEELAKLGLKLNLAKTNSLKAWTSNTSIA